MPVEECISFCRICAGGCGIRLGVEDGKRIVSVRGDPDSPLSRGYACFKGLQAAESHQGPARLLRPLKRLADGRQVEIESEQALGEIAERIAALTDEHGPEALAVFCGNGALFNIPAYLMHRPFLAALGSDQYFSTLTIDQSAKFVSFGRLGGWKAGFPSFDHMDVVLMFGANPLVSHSAVGFLQNDPVRRLKQRRAEGLKLIVVDPRNTETARNADLLLQPFPGEDAAIAGGLIRMILAEGWHDRDFCETYVGAERMAALAAAVASLEPDYVERRAGLKPGQLGTVAEWFARDARSGCAMTATGPSMAPFSNLAQHLIDCLNVVCGRFLRAGEPVHQIAAMGVRRPVHAEVVAPRRPWEKAGPSRIRGARMLYGERPTGTLADEILTPGEGQIRALIVDGGDPVTSFPDHRRAARAMAALDLLVSIEPWRSPTTAYADYVLPPRLLYERADLPMNLGVACWPGGWAQYTAPMVEVPEGSDLVDDWYVFWRIAQRLDRPILYNGVPLEMEVPPATDDLIAAIMKDAPIPLEELRRHPHGIDIGTGGEVVLPARSDARFDPMPEDVAKELAAFLAEDRGARAEGYSHLLIPRRMRDLFNSNGRHLRTVRKRTPYNPAYLHPDDLAAQGVADGELVELVSAFGRVRAIAGGDQALKRGVVSIAHGWGGTPEEAEDPESAGTPVNALIDTDLNYESINAMPHMSAVPVNIVRIGASADSPD